MLTLAIHLHTSGREEHGCIALLWLKLSRVPHLDDMLLLSQERPKKDAFDYVLERCDGLHGSVACRLLLSSLWRRRLKRPTTPAQGWWQQGRRLHSGRRGGGCCPKGGGSKGGGCNKDAATTHALQGWWQQGRRLGRRLGRRRRRWRGNRDLLRPPEEAEREEHDGRRFRRLLLRPRE